MRSNDVYSGTRNDLGYFLTLQKYIADRLGVEYGTYTHFAASIHVYDRDFNKIKDTAYGTMETSAEILDIEELLRHSDELINYVDNNWVDKLDFTNKLKNLNIIRRLDV